MPSSRQSARGEELNRLRRQLDALRDIQLVLESTMSLDEVLAEIVERTTRVMEAERTTLFVMNEDGGLVSRVADGGEIAEIRLGPGQGIAGWVARHGRPLNVRRAYEDERFDPSWDSASGFRTRCLLCHPIRNRLGNVIGVLEVLNKSGERTFADEDDELLGMLTGQVALTLENSRLMIDLVDKNRALVEAKHVLQRRNREIALLLDLERRVAESEKLEDLIKSILKWTIEATRGQVGVLYRTDTTGAEVRVIDDYTEVCRIIRVPVGTGFAGWVAAKVQELRLAAPSADPRFAGQLEARVGISLDNLAAVPLPMSDGDPRQGAILVANKKAGEGFEESDMVLLRLVSERLAQAMGHLTDREERERERRLATVGRLMAGVLHDLKSPIAVISGYAELLAEKAQSAEADEYFGHLSRAVERISNMAAEIIAFSRGERQILISAISLDEFMTRFFAQVRPIVERSNVSLVTRLRTSGTVRLDEEKISRAFHNIVINAIEVMPDGGSLTIEVDHMGTEMIFGFTDTGPGIPEEIQGSIFRSFVTLGKAQGTGLGLAVAKEIVEAHRGAISFTTARGRGTTFVVSLPA